MSNEQKPKEFWVNDTGQARYCEAYRMPLMENHCIRVIEKSAYDALKAENEKLRVRDFELFNAKTALKTCDLIIIQLRDELISARDVLEFYDGAHRLHWAISLNKLATTAHEAIARIDNFLKGGGSK